jgi:D-sedoheptulose 7-phosphate isomerase
MKKLVKMIKDARFVFVCGNGGSAATAEHFTNDLFSKGIKAICLNSNTSIMTMIANDFGYQFTFSKQLDIYATSEDLLITISCSGTSPNIVNAQIIAGFKGMKIHNFETFSNDRDYEALEDRHIQLVHKIKKLL